MWQVALEWHAMEFAQTSDFWNSTSGFDFDHITAVDMSFCTSLQNFIQIGPPSAEKNWRHVDSQDGGSQPSWILGSNNGFFERPMYDFLQVVNRHRSSKLLSFWENSVFAFWRQDPRWRISAILDFRDPIIGSLKSPCTTSYRSSIDTIALNWLVFEKIAFFCILVTDRQTDRQTENR